MRRRKIENIFANIGEDEVQETKFRSFTSWKNKEFCATHEEGIELSIIDISGFEDAHRTVLTEIGNPHFVEDMLLYTTSEQIFHTWRWPFREPIVTFSLKD